MDFSEALQCLKAGALLQCEGWNGKGMFVYLVAGSTFKSTRPPLDFIYPAGTEVTYLPHVDLRTADGKHVPWLVSQTDLLADDWRMLEQHEMTGRDA
jgi:hypothetical protein